MDVGDGEEVDTFFDRRTFLLRTPHSREFLCIGEGEGLSLLFFNFSFRS